MVQRPLRPQVTKLFSIENFSRTKHAGKVLIIIIILFLIIILIILIIIIPILLLIIIIIMIQFSNNTL